MTTTQFTTPRDLLRYAVTRFNAAKLFFGHGSAEALSGSDDRDGSHTGPNEAEP